MVKDCQNKKGSSPTSAATAKSAATPRASPDGSSSTTNKTVRIDEKSQTEASSSTPSANSTATTNELKEVLADVGKMLKAMNNVTSLRRAQLQDDPLKKRIAAMAAQLDGMAENEEESDGPSGLLDSGASNPMRVATEAEYGGSVPVKVTLGW